MRMKEVKRAGVAVAMLVVLVAAVGCGKEKPIPTPPPPPPAPSTEPTTTEVPPPPAPKPADPVEPAQQQSLADLEERVRNNGLLGDVFFRFDSYGVGAEAQQRLQKNAEFFRSGEGSGLSFTVEGHCDERGTNEYNIALGQQRSSAAVDYLVSLGIDRSRFRTISYGEERSFCTQSSEACWQENRRARFVISGRQ